MIVLDSGHLYELHYLDATDEPRQLLRFVKRKGRKFPGNKNSYAGTTMQEVVRVLVDRCEYVNQQTPCAETAQVRELLISALLLLELRAARRHRRTLNTTKAELLNGPVCTVCGHVQCRLHRKPVSKQRRD